MLLTMRSKLSREAIAQSPESRGKERELTGNTRKGQFFSTHKRRRARD